MSFIDGSGGNVASGEVNMERQLLSWLRTQVPGGQSWGKPRLLETLKGSVASSGSGTAAFKAGDSVLAHWLVDGERGEIIVDPTTPGWLRAEVLGRARRGNNSGYRLRFSDGHIHPSVPYAHIRRLN
jgi:hypothetical protein